MTKKSLIYALYVVVFTVGCSSVALCQTCDEQYTLHNSACPSGAADCQNNAGDAISSEENDANIRNSIDTCNAYDLHIAEFDSITTCADENLLVSDGVGGFDCSAGTFLVDILDDHTKVVGKLTVDGGADEVQFLVQNNSSQANLAVVFEQSDGTDNAQFDDDGDARFRGTVGIGAADASAAACIANDASDRLFHDTDCDETKDAGEEYIDGPLSSGAAGDVQYSDGSGGLDSETGFNYDDTGNVLSTGAAGIGGLVAVDSVGVGGSTFASAACISDDGADRIFHDTDCDAVKDAGEEYIDFQPTSFDTDYGNEIINSDWTFTSGGSIDISVGTLFPPGSNTLPGTCGVGEVYIDTNATSGQRWYICESTDTWVAQGGTAVHDGDLSNIYYSDGAGGVASVNELVWLTGTETLLVEGDIQASERLAIAGTVLASAACISNDGADRLYHDTDCSDSKDGGEEFIDLTAGTSVGAVGNVQYTDGAGAFLGEAAFNYTAASNELEIDGNIFIDGSTDEETLVIQGTAGQANPLLVLENNSGTNMAIFGASGSSAIVGPVGIGAATTAGSACIANDASDRLFHDTNCSNAKDAGEEFIGFIPSYCDIYESNAGGSTITVVTAGTYYGWTTATESICAGATFADFTGDATADRITIGASGGGTYLVNASVSFSAGNTDQTKGAIHLGGALQTMCEFDRTMGAAASVGSAGISCLLTLASTNYIDLRFTSNTNGDALVVYKTNLSVVKVTN